MDSGEYKHVVLGLIFLKFVSDSCQEKWQELMDLDPDFAEELKIVGCLRMLGGRISLSMRKKPEIEKVVDNALDAIEKENGTLKGVLPKSYAPPELDKRILGEIIDLFTNMNVGGNEAKEKDVLGRVYEYFLGKFAANEGKGDGEFYTPNSVVKLMVKMLQQYKDYVYDPACGSGGIAWKSMGSTSSFLVS